MTARKAPRTPRAPARSTTARGKTSAIPAVTPLRLDDRSVTIVHLSAEVAPWARVGELGDTVAELAAAQASGGRSVIVIAPAYRSVIAAYPELVPVGEPFEVIVGDRHEVIALLGEAEPDTRRPWLLFVDHRASFDRAGIYGDESGPWSDNPERFALLARAALAAVQRLVAGPMVLHAHDWHAAAACALAALEGTRRASVLTIHDAAFQGHVSRERLLALGLPRTMYTPEWFEWYGRANLLKGGVAFATRVVATSPTHAAELRSPAGGFGIDGALRWKGDRFAGVANGLDASAWNPATDARLAAKFGPGTIADRAKNKQALQRTTKLPVRARTPLVLLPGPLTLRSGASIALASEQLRTSDAHFVIAAEGDPFLIARAHELARAHPDRVAVLAGWDDRAARRALAGADLVLCPSLHEPSGRIARQALRYGSVVIARTTGAHADLTDGDDLFRFQPFDVTALDRAIEAAFAAFADKPSWTARIKAALARPAGWDDAVTAYDACYLDALGHLPGAGSST